ncbi:MAG: endonuclease [Planctomycetota bacterium]|nr:MAG: endonuclease [Planctomycetota bacterium]
MVAMKAIWRLPCWLMLLIGATACIQPEIQTSRLKVLSYNIHHGEGTDGQFDLERLAALIRAQDADLVALQEVDQGTERASGRLQAMELGRLTNMQAVFGKAMDYQGGAYGEAILSRLPILETALQPLPHSAGAEPRAALAVLVQLPDTGPDLWFVATHLDHLPDDTDRLAQAEEIRRWLVRQGPDAPMILAGDLNAVPGSAPMQIFEQDWQMADEAFQRPTFPSDQPKLKIDYVLFRPDTHWRVTEIEVVGESVASDHRPLLVGLEFSGQP